MEKKKNKGNQTEIKKERKRIGEKRKDKKTGKDKMIMEEVKKQIIKHDDLTKKYPMKEN